jgi:predicted GNAT family acetyltransferase
MTALHPGLRGRARVTVLDDAQRSAVQALLDDDPIVNAVVAARVRAAPSLRAEHLGGPLLGAHEGPGLKAACYHGGNLIPVGLPDSDGVWEALANAIARRPRTCTSLVGRREAVRTMWPTLTRRWGPARSIRGRQPLLVLDAPATVAPDPAVRLASADDRVRYAAAAATMFTEELGVSPNVSPGPVAFRTRVDEMIASGRALGAFDHRGQVVFKADLGAITRHTAQVQGVWVRPDLRSRGIAAAALASVFRYALTLAPTVSLYVNDYNTAARRVYEKLGMRQHAVLSTVLL